MGADIRYLVAIRSRNVGAFAYDPDLRGCVHQGGSEDDNGRHSYGDTWLFRNNRWQCLGRAFEIEPGDDHSLAYHGAAKLLVMSGGFFRRDPLMIRTTGGWRQVGVSPPLPRYQFRRSSGAMNYMALY
jgi:hypothetical protein